MKNKIQQLKEYLKSLGKVVIAYSSGVDSTFLLDVAHSALSDNIIAFTSNSCFFPERELFEAKEFCKSKNIKHIIYEFNPLEIDEIKNNPKNRCYYCKYALFNKILNFAKQNNIKHVLEGSNMDDLSDYRPGANAIKELNILSPLQMFKFTKEEIRLLSKELNLKSATKPSFACLASRFCYGDIITKEKLKMVEKSEDFLLNSGFKQFRVRIHDNLARIEVLKDDFSLALSKKDEIVQKLKEFGFKYVALDLEGYRTGSMNEVFKK